MKKKLETTQATMAKQLGVKKVTNIVEIANEMKKIETMGPEWEAEQKNLVA